MTIIMTINRPAFGISANPASLSSKHVPLFQGNGQSKQTIVNDGEDTFIPSGQSTPDSTRSRSRVRNVSVDSLDKALQESMKTRLDELQKAQSTRVVSHAEALEAIELQQKIEQESGKRPARSRSHSRSSARDIGIALARSNQTAKLDHLQRKALLNNGLSDEDAAELAKLLEESAQTERGRSGPSSRSGTASHSGRTHSRGRGLSGTQQVSNEAVNKLAEGFQELDSKRAIQNGPLNAEDLDKYINLLRGVMFKEEAIRARSRALVVLPPQNAVERQELALLEYLLAKVELGKTLFSD
jgi:hypothetical protein